ncbi:MAG: HNH endonuclease [Fibrobacter sp.]|nr:HNH endonuclease [Fibrobacter sp.]
MVYVVNKHGKPLMPTRRHGRVRRLIKTGLAVVINYHPFTIQLTYDTPDGVQEVTLGVDAGSKHVGFSATTRRKALFEAQLELRSDIVAKLANRRIFRRNRRNRKTRYRKCRFNNRTHSRKSGWLAPSVKQKIACHLYWIERICGMLPVSTVIVETAQFNIQGMAAYTAGTPILHGSEYQKGVQLGFHNVREYVLFRDKYMCRCCKGKSRDTILRMHHIESRKTGGNAPNNLVTLCDTCHRLLHGGKLILPANIIRGASYRDAAFMGVMRKALFKQLTGIMGQRIRCIETYGYLTKKTRVCNGLSKSHVIDARCISGNPRAVATCGYWLIRKVRVHNRQIHKATMAPGGIRKLSQCPREINGFRLNDLVECGGKRCFVSGRRRTGYFSVSDIKGNCVHVSISSKKLKRLCHNNFNLLEGCGNYDVQ